MSLKPVSSRNEVIPESESIIPHFLDEDDNIAFSDGCCNSCVGIIDMVNSTKITSGLSRAQMSKYYSLFINWAAAVVRGYGGQVVKNTGDGLLFHFSPVTESDTPETFKQCLNCSLALIRLHPNINMKFRAESLPELNYRISLDYGEISLARTMGSLSEDIFGTTVNICSKINDIAAPNTVVAGGDLYQVAKDLKGYTFHETKKALLIANRPYPVYSVSEAKITSSLRMTILGILL